MRDEHVTAMNEIMKPGAEQEKQLVAVLENVMQPIIATFAQMMQQNTEAMERMAQAMKVQNDRMEALERQIRLQTPLTPQMVRHIGDAIRNKAQGELEEKTLHDRKWCITSLAGVIRKSVLTHYGAGTLSEIPRHEYNVVLTQVDTWSDFFAVREVQKKDRARREKQEKEAETDGGQ